MEIDPRVSVIDERIKNIGKIILVSGFKGGIGKSLVSCGVALSLVEDMKRTGLLDLDITSSSCHKILGINELYPLEEKGILPVDVYGIKFMSFHFFSNNMPIALRGSSISDAIKEIFCIVQWGYLDYLIVDMPPGFYDVAFDIMNFIKNFRVIAIKTPSKLSADVYDRMINIYKGKYDLIEIENMTQMEGDFKIRFDPSIDGAIGDINKIKNTIFYKDLKNIFDKYL